MVSYPCNPRSTVQKERRSFMRLFGRGGRRQEPTTPTIYTYTGADADLELPLLELSPSDRWTIRDACEGTQIFGGIGSGKTSGSGAAIARAFLSAGFGGLVCCAKPDERALWQDYAAKTGRSDQLVIVRPGENGQPPRYAFNFLDYELRRPGAGAGQTENLVNLFTEISNIVSGKAQEQAGDNFFTTAMEELVRNAVDVLSLSGEKLTLKAITDLVTAAPRTIAQAENAEWQQNSFTGQLLQVAFERASTPLQQHDAMQAAAYWTQRFPGYNERTRGDIIATFSGIADRLLRGLAWQLLCNEITIYPEVAFDGYIIVLDLSVQEYGKLGRTIQGIWKYMFQQAVLRRNVREHPLPVFLWCDEAQHFISPFDYLYQSTVRSFRGCTVYLTQNISNYYSVLGANAKASADSLLGNLSTKIFHANSDHATNEYAANTIAQRREMTTTTNSQQQNNPNQPGSTGSVGTGETDRFPVMPYEFTVLRKGGPQNGYGVEGIVFESGRRWNQSQGETYLKTIFPQQRQ